MWKEQRTKLSATEAYENFNTRLIREWSIETGIIEGLYSIDRGITQLLIEQGIDAALIPHGATDQSADKIVEILRDQQDTLEGVFDFVANHREMSISYIKEIHALMTRSQSSVSALDQFGKEFEVPLLRGDWKQQPNNPTLPSGRVFEYCPPEQTASQMDQLISLHEKHSEENIPADVEASWLHHRFTQIHPFQDGNGRVARTLASIIFLRANWFPFIIDRDKRSTYINALEKADEGDLAPLTTLFAKIQKSQFLSALSISEGILQATLPLAQVIESGVERLKAKFEDESEGGSTEQDGPHPLMSEIFQFVFNEDPNDVLDRFESWFNDVLISGLEQWRRQL